MLRQIFHHTIRAIILLLAFGLAGLLFLRAITMIAAAGKMYRPEDAPARQVAIVFGAGLQRDGSPTPILRDRVETAVSLFAQGKVEKLLMSGDNRYLYYNEPGAMKAYALRLGIPEDAIVLDYAGRSTYETCYRASAIFGIQEAILVTQSFHLPRALYLCNILEVSSVGVSADIRAYRQRLMAYWNLRELGATVNAFWEVHFSRPQPVLGNPEPIFPAEAQ